MKTLPEWNEVGRLIIKGSKAKRFNKDGKALFHLTQTRIMPDGHPHKFRYRKLPWNLTVRVRKGKFYADRDQNVSNEDHDHPMESVLQEQYCGGGG